MSNFQNRPLNLSLKANIRYTLCLCGLSKKFPLCDGGHKSTNTKPCKFTLTKDEEINVCQCGKSNKLPYCDGSHINS